MINHCLGYVLRILSVSDCGFGSLISESEVFRFINNKEFGLPGVMWLLILSAISEWFGNTKPKEDHFKAGNNCSNYFCLKAAFPCEAIFLERLSNFFITISYFPRVSLALH